MLRRFFIATAVFLVLASLALAGANMNISVEVVVPIGNYTNSSVNLSANQTTFINAPEANTTLELASSQNVSGSINILLTSTPVDIPSLSVPSLDKYLKIEASDSIKANLTYIIIKLYYTDEEVIASGIEEGSLSFYFWNQTSSTWEKLTTAMDWVYGAGVDTVENYIWANVSHSSDYSIGGLLLPQSMEIKREMPLLIKTNKKFDVTLQIANFADFKLLNISIKEKIPEGYDLKEVKKISPKPERIVNEGSFTVIYWKINQLTSHKNLSLKYSLSAPKKEGNYTFRVDAFGFDLNNNKYAAMNISEQEVKKPPLLKSILEFLGIFP